MLPAARLPVESIRSHTGLRGVAAFTVFLAHLQANGLAHGFNEALYHLVTWWFSYAVDLFFFLSGFIMYWVYVADRPQVGWGAFYRARAGRILPLYYLTLAATIPIYIAGLIKHGTWEGAHLIPKLVLNLLIGSGVITGVKWTINLPSWSVSVEMFCYLAVFPAMVWAHRRVRSLSELPVATCATAACTALVVLIYFHPALFTIQAIDWEGIWAGRGIFGFSAGFFLCAIFRQLKDRPISGHLADVIILGVVALILGAGNGTIPGAAIVYTFPCLLFFLAYDRGLCARALGTRLLQWLGDRSYSIYLWQFPGIASFLFLRGAAWHHPIPGGETWSLVNFALVVGFVLGISELSYSCFEMPIRRWFKGPAQVPAVKAGSLQPV
jgi:peptidoglycan/LPS O-acetylase OafA/YrhL